MPTDWTAIVALVGSSLGLSVACWLAYRFGRIAKEKEITKESLEVRNEQLKDAVNRPSKSDIADKLRDGKF